MTDRPIDRRTVDAGGERPGVAATTPLSTADGGQPRPAVDSRPVTHSDSAGEGTFVHRNRPQAVDKGASARELSGDASADDGTDDLARALLAELRAGRRSQPSHRGARGARDRNRRENLAGRNRGGYSGARPDPDRDPHRLGDLVAGFVDEQGWSRPLADARVFAEWPLLVGADVAAHCSPQSLRDGELRLAAESTAWATQLRLLTSVLLSRLAAELGSAVVRRIVITGPVAPSWKHGGWSVRGARGPRDTYG